MPGREFAIDHERGTSKVSRAASGYFGFCTYRDKYLPSNRRPPVARSHLYESAVDLRAATEGAVAGLVEKPPRQPAWEGAQLDEADSPHW
jgi:hypothetical protein